jgi:hypothetical protein
MIFKGPRGKMQLAKWHSKDRLGEKNEPKEEEADADPTDRFAYEIAVSEADHRIKFEEALNSFQVVKRIDLPLNDPETNSFYVVFEKRRYCLNFNAFFSNDFFLTIEILARYIEKRNSRMYELELQYILQLINSNGWGRALNDHFPSSLLILSEIFTAFEFTNSEVFFDCLMNGSKVGIIANKEV